MTDLLIKEWARLCDNECYCNDVSTEVFMQDGSKCNIKCGYLDGLKKWYAETYQGCHGPVIIKAIIRGRSYSKSDIDKVLGCCF